MKESIKNEENEENEEKEKLADNNEIKCWEEKKDLANKESKDSNKKDTYSV